MARTVDLAEVRELLERGAQLVEVLPGPGAALAIAITGTDAPSQARPTRPSIARQPRDITRMG